MRTMANSVYPLKAALQLREVQLDEARASLQEALAALSEAERRFRDAEDRLAAHIQATDEERRRAAALAGPTPAAELEHRQRYLKRRREEQGALRGERETLHAAVGRAEAKAEAARSALADARAQKKTIEAHRDKWRDARKTAQEAREEDDAANVIGGRRN